MMGMAKKFARLKDVPHAAISPTVQATPTASDASAASVSRTLRKSTQSKMVTIKVARIACCRNERSILFIDSLTVIGAPVACGSSARRAVTNCSSGPTSHMSPAGCAMTKKRPPGETICARTASGSAVRKSRRAPSAIASSADRVRATALSTDERANSSSAGVRPAGFTKSATVCSRCASARMFPAALAASPSAKRESVSIRRAALRIPSAFHSVARRGRAGAASTALANCMRRAARCGVSMTTASSTLRTCPTSGCARKRSASGGISSIDPTINAPNQLAEAESSITRCSHSTLSKPLACSLSRLLSNRMCVNPYQPAASATAQEITTARHAAAGRSARSTPSRCEKNAERCALDSLLFTRRASKITSSAGSMTTMAASVRSSPIPDTTPNSRRPWNSVNHASRNTPADVSAPAKLLGTAVRIM